METFKGRSENTYCEWDSPQSVHSAIPFAYFDVLQSIHINVALAGGILLQAKQSDVMVSCGKELKMTTHTMMETKTKTKMQN